MSSDKSGELSPSGRGKATRRERYAAAGLGFATVASSVASVVVTAGLSAIPSIVAVAVAATGVTAAGLHHTKHRNQAG